MTTRDEDLAGRVVRWQVKHGRNHLPWQGTRDPYRVWLSEIMLQQTQVATASSYFHRFVDVLPDVRSLAAASQDQVLSLWSGLGYYSRARNLHRCAHEVMDRWGGVFPHMAAELETLPGIGRSTAAAIASLCHGERVAILDANVRRVVARVTGFDADLAQQANLRRLWSIATDLLPESDLAHVMPRYTQGMMDLGATVCLPRQPACGECPLQENCVARAQQAPERYPVLTRRVKRSAESVWLLWAHTDDQAVWLQRRPSPGVWGGLYCLPWFESRDALVQSVPRRYRDALHDLNPFKHVLTHKDLHLHPVRVRLPAQRGPDQPLGQWKAANTWPALGLPAPVRRVLLDQA